MSLTQVGCLESTGDESPEVAEAKIVPLVSGQIGGEHCTEVEQNKVKTFVVYTSASLTTGDDTKINGGHVGVRTPTPPDDTYSLTVGDHALIDTSYTTFAKAASLLDDSKVGALQTDDLDQRPGATYTSLAAFPSVTPIPNVVAAPPEGGDDDDRMLSGESTTLTPFTYRDITLAANSLVRLAPGTYSARRLVLGQGARLIAQGPVTITVKERITATNGFAMIRPTNGNPALTAKDFVIRTAVGPQSMDNVAGVNIGPSSTVNALIIAPRARVDFGTNLNFRGALVARRAIFANNSTVNFQDGVTGEVCQPYDCAGTLAGMIDDGDPCTVDTCTATEGIKHSPAPDGTECTEDGSPGACVAGGCEAVCDAEKQMIKGDPKTDAVRSATAFPTPVGRYVVRYIGGCMKYNPLWWWSVNGSEDGKWAWHLVAGADRYIMPGTFGFFNSENPPPGTKSGFKDFGECVEKNLELSVPIVIEHDTPNSQLGVKLRDRPLDDNRHGLLGQNPLWSITPFECSGS